MSQLAKAINLGGVNCYLLAGTDGFVLIDTGFIGKRKQLDQALVEGGCAPGKLKLILLTHGDSDHADNCVHLRNMHGCKIAMHELDSGMVEHGDMSWNRKAKADKYSLPFRLIGLVAKAFTTGYKFETFKPDVLIGEDFDLKSYGLNARILHLPGHSKGSIGVLTEDGELYCGDFAYNLPGMGFIDDMADHLESIEKLNKLPIHIVYPGHGKPFPMSILLKKG
jgi:glyoxylase-like metal-dependent hydrolase (beta-lactamase superfamily II)